MIHMYDLTGFVNGAAFEGFESHMPPEHLSLGFAGGGISTLILQLLRDWGHHPIVDPGPLPPLPECQCPVISLGELTDREFWFLLLGLAIGIFLLPLIEGLLVLRQAWSVWLRERLISSQSKQLYRPG